MLKKKSRDEIINQSYHRYAFEDDQKNLPSWFVEDEATHYQTNLPVTKEEMREQRLRLKAINARPIKKVAEAKARKKLRALRAWNKIRRQAVGIADSTDLSEKSKIKQIQSLYARLGRKQKKLRPVLMVSGRNRKARPADGTKPAKNAPKRYVDKRLKSDKLGLKHARKRHARGKVGKKSTKRQLNRKNLRQR
ncbi:hypothetical protein RFI_19652 [Reticulomyxa filosa]|uniref:Ribosomal RNA methyltransferase SPB1-like C-terminal domain-containing protein n=1 Tax=Reticulomyxa filosa TaxID=46433 RepID=X6MW25_RETFI|nr:hypothetical protein RFI_19652 [Reticulomyxa filosa]|eukprot:ETO17667.1 hypothetical protein RFI_19652 [Reticulomyxa filosa]